MPAELGGHVADDDVGGSAKSLEELRLHLGILKVAAEELDAFQRNERGEVHREHAAGRADPLPGHLGPASGGRPEVDDHVALPEEADPSVDLRELDRGAAAVRLLLRGPIEPVVTAGLHPGFAHRRAPRPRGSITLSRPPA